MKNRKLFIENRKLGCSAVIGDFWEYSQFYLFATEEQVRKTWNRRYGK